MHSAIAKVAIIACPPARRLRGSSDLRHQHAQPSGPGSTRRLPDEGYEPRIRRCGAGTLRD